MRGATLGGRALLLMALAPAPAFSQGTAAQRAACTPDAFRLCSSDIPDVERITACMRRQQSRLSAACKLVFDKVETPTATATRSLDAAAGPSNWCNFGPNPAPGDDVWVAWCKETGGAK